ncbi:MULTISPECIES: hypothetical protein [unclassified Halomonas]|uniref:hypothetical protein n=1 Tax=unclassified Halomonas TaxID=2609666 RepID=UPI0005FC4B31|nr:MULTISPECIES: hypothetical protein [unclassified Halomonas]CEP33902.1 Putative uncharacterized protein [Halomonas sp. R57-5]
MHRFLHLLMAVCLFQLFLVASSVVANEDDSWKVVEYPYFSIRCSEGPFKRSLGSIESEWNEFIYLKWDGYELSHLRYSATTDEPHHWHDDESRLSLMDESQGGDSVISVSAMRNEDLEVLNIDIDVDATKESGLLRFVGDFFTHGSWKIVAEEGGAPTLEETTADFYDDKLVGSGSHNWNDCRLMDEFGRDDGIGYSY